MKISADGKKLLVGGSSGDLELISITDWEKIKGFWKILNLRVRGIVITADEKFFFVYSLYGRFRQWNYEDGTLVRDYGEITDNIHSLCI
jgi:hypothetical protein